MWNGVPASRAQPAAAMIISRDAPCRLCGAGWTVTIRRASPAWRACSDWKFCTARGSTRVGGGGAVPVVEAAGEDDADPEALGGGDDRGGVLVGAVVQVKEVADGGDAVGAASREGEERADLHAVGVEARRVAVERVAPLEERQVVAEPRRSDWNEWLCALTVPGRAARPAPVDGARAGGGHVARGRRPRR